MSSEVAVALYPIIASFNTALWFEKKILLAAAIVIGLTQGLFNAIFNNGSFSISGSYLLNRIPFLRSSQTFKSQSPVDHLPLEKLQETDLSTAITNNKQGSSFSLLSVLAPPTPRIFSSRVFSSNSSSCGSPSATSATSMSSAQDDKNTWRRLKFLQIKIDNLAGRGGRKTEGLQSFPLRVDLLED